MKERNERMKSMNDVRSEHTAIRKDAQRQTKALGDILKATIQTLGELKR